MGIVADLFVADGGCFEMSEGVRDWRCEASEVVRDRAWRIAPSGPLLAQVMEKIENC